MRIVVDNPSSRDRLLDLRTVLDNGVFFVGASHEGAIMDVGLPDSTATVRWPPLALPAGTRGELGMTILARADDLVPDLRTGDLSVDVRIVDLPERTEEVLRLYQERAGAPARAAIKSAAGLFPIVPPLVLGVVLWLVLHRARASYSKNPQFRFGRIVAAGAAVICAAAAAALVWSTIEPYVRFDETTCRVLDRRVFATEVSRSSTDRSTRRPPTLQLHPTAAVEIDTGDEMRIAAGMSTGGGTRSLQELRMLPIGLETKCWIDPGDPSRFTLVRGLPIAGGVGLTMLLVVMVVLGLIATRLGRNLDPPGA